jgi:ASC-1-like (ASCH) protein
MHEYRLKRIEDLLKEVVAKQAFLLDHILHHGRKLDATTSEMKSNYVAFEAMFQEIAKNNKA